VPDAWQDLERCASVAPENLDRVRAVMGPIVHAWASIYQIAVPALEDLVIDYIRVWRSEGGGVFPRPRREPPVIGGWLSRPPILLPTLNPAFMSLERTVDYIRSRWPKGVRSGGHTRSVDSIASLIAYQVQHRSVREIVRAAGGNPHTTTRRVWAAITGAADALGLRLRPRDRGGRPRRGSS
jgi:hypothetical protein